MLPVVVLALAGLTASPAAGAPENLARRATVTASSEYSANYRAEFAADGVIPEMLSRDDLNRAWCVKGSEARGRATFVLEWPQPVKVAEIIYYGRTAWLMYECFRTYEIRFDDSAQPVASGCFEMNAGPQRIKVQPALVRRITIDFLEAYNNGSNAGAAEIEVYSESPPEDALPRLKRLPTNLAMRAEVSASSEHSDGYRARFAIDGLIPEPFSGADPGRVWAVNGPQAAGKATFTLKWDEPVTVREVVYYGRTAVLIDECFRDYELLLDDETEPAASGRFERGAGAQVVRIKPRQARQVALRFLSSYGGPNPGASEIQVYGEPAPADFLPRFQRDGWDAPEESLELAQAVRDGALGFDKMVVIRRHELNPSHVYTAACEGFRPGGGLYMLSPPAPSGELTELVASPEGQILDLDLSYDARQIIFSWRPTASAGYHLYRINADGSELVQLTDGPWHDYNACWLPDGGIAFLSTRALAVALCFTTPAGILHRMDADGGNVRRLSGNYVNDFTPSVLPDGRILYSRWEYIDRPAIPIQGLWAINPDGTGLSVYYGNRVLSPASFLEARPVPATGDVMCTLTAHNGPIRGGVGLVDRRTGVNAQEAIHNLTPLVDIGRVDQGSGNHVKGKFESPYPLDRERFLVSGNGSIYIGDVSGRWAVVKPSDGLIGYYNPQPLVPRERPPVVASVLPDRPAAEATVYLLDVYEGLEPHVRRGEVKQICVVEEVAKPLRTPVLGFGFQRPVISCGAAYAAKKIWGYAPVDEDGSAHFRVPPNRPIYFEALDEHGQAVQRMRSFTHLAPGETQGCIGCHEPRTETPRTASVAALRRQADSLQTPEWGLADFEYSRIVQPVLDRHCTRCHSGPTPPQGIDLTGDRTDWFSVSYDVLTRGYVNWIDTRNGQEQNILEITPRAWGSPASRLTGILLSGHPTPEGQPRISLDEAGRRRLLAWIDLNVPYYGTYEMADPQAEGGRRVYPRDLDDLLSGVAQRRCAGCHESGVPSRGFLRIENPQMNDFLLAPLAKSAGGRQACGAAVFETTGDPDYQALLSSLKRSLTQLTQRPRMDMSGARPGAVDRSCL